MIAHPFDPRVAVASARDEFVEAAHDHGYKAVLLEKPFRDRTTHVRNIFQSIWDAAAESAAADLYPFLTFEEKRKKLLRHNFGAAVGENRRFEFEPKFPANFEAARPYLMEMVNTYFALTGRPRIMVELFPNLRTVKSHSHTYPVLNCPQLNNGASWYDPEKSERYVNEGDWFFMTPGFKHGSTKGERFTVVVGPDIRSILS